MNFAKDKTATVIALFLMSVMAFSLVALPVVNAHDPPWTVPTSAYVVCTPNPIGVDQTTTIVVWVDRYSPFAGGGIGQRWDGFKIDITKPDGNKQTIGPFECSSDVGSDWRQYTPDQVGTYTIVFSWPGETAHAMPGLPNTGSSMFDPNNEGDYYEGATSEPAYLVVQEEPITDWQEPPLPTEYWQRPINAANRGWSQLASNWLGGTWLVNNFQPAGTAPESPHILWTQPITPGIAGGISDAQWPGISINAEDYEAPWSQAIIMNGKIYYNTPSVSDIATYGYYCLDLHTGEQIWYKNGTDNGLNNPFTTGTLGSHTALGQVYPLLTQGQLYHYHSVNGEGMLSYLIMVQGSTWYFLDATTGNWMFTLVHVPGGSSVTDQDGSLLKYSYNPSTGNLLCWNSSQSILPAGPVGTQQQQWKPPLGYVIDAVHDTLWYSGPSDGTFPAESMLPRSGYTMNVTIQKNLPGSITVLQDDNRVPKEIFGFYQKTISAQGSSTYSDTFSVWLASIDEHVTAYSPLPQYTATQQNNLGFGATILLNKDITVPLPGKNYTWSMSGVSYNDQVFCLHCKQTSQTWGYSLETGALLWGPTLKFNDMSFYGVSSNMYYGKVLECTGYAGVLAAYDPQTGDLLWTYNATAPGHEGYYGENMPLSIGAVCDGKVYTFSSEHSPSKPLWRASYIRCINMTDGTELWKLLNFGDFMMRSYSIADGLLVTASDYDNLMYCLGKGPSATTLMASPEVSIHGSSVLIKGMITDTSPGTTELAQTARFANGVPAISDKDQEAWMEYLYEQQAMPDAEGVEVVLETLDPNGNFYEIGRTTSDASGMYSYAFTPEVPGLYTIIATFEGSNSYYGSYAETAINVEEAPQASPTPTPPPPSMADIYLMPATIGIIVAIVIATLVIVLLLRKR